MKNKRVIFQSVIIMFCIGIMIPFLMMAMYSRPCADDLNYSAMVYQTIKSGNHNIFHILKTAYDVDVMYYNTWQGLYTSAFLLALQPGIFSEKLYGIGAIILIILMLGCIYLVLHMLNKHIWSKRFDRLSVAMFSFVTTAIILIGLPSTIEGLYWFNGAWNYVPFFFLSVLNIALLLVWNTIDRDRKKWVYIILSSVLSFIISGGNHVTAFLNIMMLTFVLVISVYKQKIKALQIAISWAVALLGFYIMYKAPGTAARQACFEKQGVGVTMVNSFKEFVNLIESYTNVTWIMLMMVALLFAMELENEGDVFTPINPLIYIACSCVIMCGILCVPFYPMGNFGAPRVYNIFWLTFMALSFANMVYVVCWIRNRDLIDIKDFTGLDRGITGSILVALIITMLLPSSNFISVQKELVEGTAKSYAEACDARYELMESSTDEILYVKALPLSSNIYFGDLSWDMQDYRNVGWHDYYGRWLVLTE